MFQAVSFLQVSQPNSCVKYFFLPCVRYIEPNSSHRCTLPQNLWKVAQIRRPLIVPFSPVLSYFFSFRCKHMPFSQISRVVSSLVGNQVSRLYKTRMTYLALQILWFWLADWKTIVNRIEQVLPRFILITKPKRCTNFSNLFFKWNSTCFGQFLCPSSGV